VPDLGLQSFQTQVRRVHREGKFFGGHFDGPDLAGAKGITRANDVQAVAREKQEIPLKRM
jgi:hypothetical protein